MKELDNGFRNYNQLRSALLDLSLTPDLVPDLRPPPSRKGAPNSKSPRAFLKPKEAQSFYFLNVQVKPDGGLIFLQRRKGLKAET